MNDIEFIEECLASYIQDQRRAVENSNSCTPSFYTNEERRIVEEQSAIYMAMARIKERLGE
jgi:hypothetical protein